MRTGSIEGKIDGLYQVIYDSGELGTAATTITISSLTGDSTKEYVLILRLKNGYDGATYVYVRPNNDSTANTYGYQYFAGTGTSEVAGRSILEEQWLFGHSDQLNGLCFSILHMTTKSGHIRLSHCHRIFGITETVSQIIQLGQSWKNTADEITSLVVYADQADGFGVGSRLILMEKTELDTMKTGDIDPQGTIEGAWELIAETDITGSAATTFTWSGLTGDTDCVYKIKGFNKNSYAGAMAVYVRLNNDSGTTSGYQYMKSEDAVDTAISASNNTYFTILNLAELESDISFGECVLYAKSGENRMGITLAAQAVTGEDVDEVTMWGSIWNNSADEVTSITVVASQADGLGIGSHYELWRLNL